MLWIVTCYFLFITFPWPRPWPRPQEIGLGVGLDLKALASVSASLFWPRLTSLRSPILKQGIAGILVAKKNWWAGRKQSNRPSIDCCTEDGGPTVWWAAPPKYDRLSHQQLGLLLKFSAPFGAFCGALWWRHQFSKWRKNKIAAVARPGFLCEPWLKIARKIAW